MKKQIVLSLLIIFGGVGYNSASSQEKATTGPTFLEKAPIFRVARPSDDLEALKAFYVDGLGLELIDQFEGHDGFNGIMIGRKGWPYHFEFTHAEGHIAGKAPTKDNLVVFYLPERSKWLATVTRMKDAGFAAVKSFNPYWDIHGITFEDPDGYRVVLQNAAWE